MVRKSRIVHARIPAENRGVLRDRSAGRNRPEADDGCGALWREVNRARMISVDIEGCESATFRYGSPPRIRDASGCRVSSGAMELV